MEIVVLKQAQRELRLSGKRGECRVFYVIRVGDAIYVLHAMAKKKNTLDRKTTEFLRSRMRSLGL